MFVGAVFFFYAYRIIPTFALTTRKEEEKTIVALCGLWRPDLAFKPGSLGAK